MNRRPSWTGKDFFKVPVQDIDRRHKTPAVALIVGGMGRIRRA